jgi:hypothetical protein
MLLGCVDSGCRRVWDRGRSRRVVVSLQKLPTAACKAQLALLREVGMLEVLHSFRDSTG